MTITPEGLRDRRRHQTTLDIQMATLDLLERNGWESTTVAQIAAATGISSRTFFRYFDSKEQAAMPSQRRLWHACQSFTVTEPTMHTVHTAIEKMLRAALLGDDGMSEVDLHRRVAKLFQTDPQLYIVASAQDAEYVNTLFDRCQQLLPEHDRTELRALAEHALVIWRTAWWHWSAEISTQPEASPAESFELALRAVHAQ